MKIRSVPYVFIAILTLVSLACSIGQPGIQRLETGPTQTIALNKPTPNSDTVQDIVLTVAMGDLTLSGGAESLLQGEPDKVVSIVNKGIRGADWVAIS